MASRLGNLWEFLVSLKQMMTLDEWNLGMYLIMWEKDKGRPQSIFPCLLCNRLARRMKIAFAKMEQIPRKFLAWILRNVVSPLLKNSLIKVFWKKSEFCEGLPCPSYEAVFTTSTLAVMPIYGLLCSKPSSPLVRPFTLYLISLLSISWQKLHPE